MKKLIIVFLLAVLAGELQAQGVSFGFKAGANFSSASFTAQGVTISPSGITSYHGGLFMKGGITDKISIQPEVLYSKTGFSFSSGGLTAKDELSYISIPVLFRYNFIPAFNLHFGPQYNILLSAKETVTSSSSSASGDVKDSYKSGEFALAFGAGFDAPGGFTGGLRYVLGLSDINNISTSPPVTLKTSMVQLYVGFTFGVK